MAIGSFGALCHGVSLPCMIIVFGEMLDSFLSVGDICVYCENSTMQQRISAYNSLPGTAAWNCDLMFSTKDTDVSHTE